MTFLPRRSFIAAALWLAGAAIPLASAQQAPAPQLAEPQPGYHRLKIGDVEVIALSDGTVPLDTQVLHAPAPHIARLLEASHTASPVNASVNAYLVKLEGRLILVDAGSGELYGPTLNKLPDTLRRLGLGPEQVTDILVTHVHTDHTGGLMDGTTRVYPNAVVHVDQREVAYWLDPAQQARAPAHQQRLFDEAQAKFAPYVAAGQVKAFDGATPLFPGLRSQPARGHTPGHSFYVLERGGQKLVFWGDLLHVAEVQLPEPGVTIDFDADPPAAAAQRRAAFADAARHGYLVAPAHVSFPGIGRLRRDGKGYRWLPMPYVNDAVPAPAGRYEKTPSPRRAPG